MRRGLDAWEVSKVIAGVGMVGVLIVGGGYFGVRIELGCCKCHVSMRCYIKSRVNPSSSLVCGNVDPPLHPYCVARKLPFCQFFYQSRQKLTLPLSFCRKT